MSYYYGSDSLEIKNPFKKEGIIFLSVGALEFILGLFSLFTIRNQIATSGTLAGWLGLGICLILLISGISYISSGIYKILRFYVGRGIPASLAKNVSKSETHVREPEVLYHSKTLEQMLMGRKNPTFAEPTSFLDQLLYSVFPKLIFLPYQMRNYISVLLSKTAYSLVWLAVYILAVLSGSLGLTKLTQTSFTDWMSIGLAIILLLIWTNHKISIKSTNKLKIENFSKGTFVFLIVLAVLLPVFGEILINNGVKIPDAPLNPFYLLILDFILIAVTNVAGILLAKHRSDMLNPLTEVSEYRNHWQENVHPRDIFRCFEMEMANMRFKEMPNRVYRTLNPRLNMEGSSDKGNFFGDTIVETQPVYEEIEYPQLFKNIRLIVSIFGGVLLSFSSILLFALNRQIPNSFSLDYLFNCLYVPIILGAFGSIAINIAHFYWSEVNFKSYLVHFQVEGTYTESKISTGMAITDSTRSENVIVRSSCSPLLILSQIRTTTLVSSGSKNLEGTRYVLDMRKADHILENLVKGIRSFLDNQQSIANSISERDMASINNFYALNQVSPANLAAKAMHSNLPPADNREKLES
ncbi:MAG TPA: hypothetical protein PKW03_03285 [Acetivibrio sp.]|nr:hypothetical protein [Acetivibrio sp.]